MVQDTEISSWSNKFARTIIKIGAPAINILAKGLKSSVKGISRDCLVCTAWLGSELASLGENDIRYFACEILLHDIVRHLHPGCELDERILACLCVYNYTSGKGKESFSLPILKLKVKWFSIELLVVHCISRFWNVEIN
jgi:hypothetical protein